MTKNEKKAFELYLKVAETEYLDVIFELYLKVAETEHIDTEYNLVICYANEKKMTKNEKIAFELYSKVAKMRYLLGPITLKAYYRK
ncbi:hypothetical protein G9A89_002384 [Geosiphon pyriformis]|nr:hypothetical protein G9A89_002384 [Geosiphon pyriformis]